MGWPAALPEWHHPETRGPVHAGEKLMNCSRAHVYSSGADYKHKIWSEFTVGKPMQLSAVFATEADNNPLKSLSETPFIDTGLGV